MLVRFHTSASSCEILLYEVNDVLLRMGTGFSIDRRYVAFDGFLGYYENFRNGFAVSSARKKRKYVFLSSGKPMLTRDVIYGGIEARKRWLEF